MRSPLEKHVPCFGLFPTDDLVKTIDPTLKDQNGSFHDGETPETAISQRRSAKKVTGEEHGESRLGGNSGLDVLLLKESQGKVQPCMPKKVRRAGG